MIKLLIGGSPCTYWSIAQKNNREKTASGIGWELFKNYLIANGGGQGAKTGLYAIPTDKPVYEVKDGFITIKGKQYPLRLAYI